MLFCTFIFLIVTKVGNFKLTRYYSSLIVLWSVAEVVVYLLQLALAFAYGFWAISALTGAGIVLHIILGCIAHKVIIKKETKDSAFRHWTLTHS